MHEKGEEVIALVYAQSMQFLKSFTYFLNPRYVQIYLHEL